MRGLDFKLKEELLGKINDGEIIEIEIQERRGHRSYKYNNSIAENEFERFDFFV